MTPDSLGTALAALAGRRVAVVGDVMTDEYVWGDVSRVSPDAPVQVVEVARRTRALGGAANVAANVAAGGGRPELVGLIGADSAGASLREAALRAGLDPRGLVVDPSRPTTVKTRVVARGQQIVRLDEESRAPLAENVRAALIPPLERALDRADAVLISDYAKGVVDRRLVEETLRATRRSGSGPPVIVDPKSPDMAVYAGCTVITPNRKEAEAAAGMALGDDASLREGARRIRSACGAPWVIVTLGDRGLALSSPDGGMHLVPARAREVFDVTGAGDTVLAYLGLGLAAGLPPLEAATIANLAAGVAVGRVGAAAVLPADILRAGGGADSSLAKFAPPDAARVFVEHLRSIGRRVVFTNGCFDLLHAGHVHLLESARRLGDALVVALNTDASVRRLKGPERPVVGQEDRIRILCALDAVDLVVLFDDDTPMRLIEDLRPDVLVKGGDYSRDDIVGAALVEGWGGRVETIPLVAGRSTSSILSAVKRTQD